MQDHVRSQVVNVRELHKRITWQWRKEYNGKLDEETGVVPLMSAEHITKWKALQMDCVEDAIKSVMKAARNAANRNMQSRDVPLTVLTAGSGRGKTRFMEEVRRTILAEEQMVPVMITFNDAMELDYSKAAVRVIVRDDDRELRAAVEISIRLWFAAFKTDGTFEGEWEDPMAGAAQDGRGSARRGPPGDRLLLQQADCRGGQRT